jgi:hypothetical protein
MSPCLGQRLVGFVLVWAAARRETLTEMPIDDHPKYTEWSRALRKLSIERFREAKRYTPSEIEATRVVLHQAHQDYNRIAHDMASGNGGVAANPFLSCDADACPILPKRV